VERNGLEHRPLKRGAQKGPHCSDAHEEVGVITVHASGTGFELAAPAQLLEILRHSLATTTSAAQ
jgi:hypothetical protein